MAIFLDITLFTFKTVRFYGFTFLSHLHCELYASTALRFKFWTVRFYGFTF